MSLQQQQQKNINYFIDTTLELRACTCHSHFIRKY